MLFEFNFLSWRVFQLMNLNKNVSFQRICYFVSLCSLVHNDSKYFLCKNWTTWKLKIVFFDCEMIFFFFVCFLFFCIFLIHQMGCFLIPLVLLDWFFHLLPFCAHWFFNMLSHWFVLYNCLFTRQKA
jgi:hypothetical protein